MSVWAIGMYLIASSTMTSILLIGEDGVEYKAYLWLAINVVVATTAFSKVEAAGPLVASCIMAIGMIISGPFSVLAVNYIRQRLRLRATRYRNV